MPYLIQTNDGNLAIALRLDALRTDRHNFLILNMKNKATYVEEKEKACTIYTLNEGDVALPLGPYSSNFRELDKVWQDMEVISDDKWDKARLEKLFPEAACYWYLMKTRDGQYCIGGHVGPCNPLPFFYLEDPNNLESLIEYLNLA